MTIYFGISFNVNGTEVTKYIFVNNIFIHFIRYNNASYKIDDIDWTMNPESTFTNSKGETMSFIDYYKRQYQIDIQDRKQPLLVNRPTLKKRGVAEAEADRVVCLIPGMLCFYEKNRANCRPAPLFIDATPDYIVLDRRNIQELVNKAFSLKNSIDLSPFK